MRTQNLIYLERWDSAGNVTQFLFPVNPETIDIAHRRETQDGAILKLGNFSRPGARQPIEVNFASFFPNPDQFSVAPDWVNVPLEELDDPWELRRMIREWQNEEDVIPTDAPTPLRLTITDSDGFSVWVTITDFSVTTRPREVGDLYFSISFREASRMPDLKVGRTSKQRRSTTRPQRNTTKVIPKSTRSLAGENITLLCKRIYGEVSVLMIRKLWAAQTQAFRVKLGSSAKVIPTGTVVALVPRDEMFAK